MPRIDPPGNPSTARSTIYPRKEVYVDKKTLEKHGFPAEVSEAFLLTADQTNCVVMSRAPGGAGTELIRHGYDLKGYLIKAKSCNWGPMAGFLCQIPALNKQGAKKIGYNYKNHKKYLEYRRKQGILSSQAYIPLKIPDARKKQILEGATGPDDKTGFLETGFFKELDEDTVIGLAFARSKDGTIDRSVVVEILMVRNKPPKGKPVLWSLYHGNILYRLMKTQGPNKEVVAAETGPYGGYFNLFDPAEHEESEGVDRKKMPALEKVKVAWPERPGETTNRAKIVEAGILEILENQSNNLKGDYEKIGAESPDIAPKYDTIIDEFTEWLQKINIDRRPERAHFYPICGAQNPYPPYGQDARRISGPLKAIDTRGFVSDPDESYKNAATGDYDLFAIWPARPTMSIWELTRLAERTGYRQDETMSQQGVGVLIDNAIKPSALTPRASPEVMVEVIAGFDEIETWEHSELGNITNLTATVVQTLNSLVSLAAERSGGLGAGRVSPNQAFHSDEGGRPGIDEVDYPFAVYLPKRLFEQLTKACKARKDLTSAQRKAITPTSRMLLIDEKRHDDFVEMACMLRETCYLPFNFVWLMQMFVLLCSRDKLESPGINTDGESKPEKVRKDRQKYFNDRLAELDKKECDLDRMRAGLTKLFIGDLLQETAAVDRAMNSLANAFFEIAARDLGGTRGTVVRMMDRLRLVTLESAQATVEQTP